MSRDTAPAAALAEEVATQLAGLRTRFDVVDDAIIALVLERQALADEAGRIKASAGLPVVDEVREAEAERRRREVAHRTSTAASDAETEGAAVDAAVVVDVFAALVAASRARQQLTR